MSSNFSGLPETSENAWQQHVSNLPKERSSNDQSVFVTQSPVTITSITTPKHHNAHKHIKPVLYETRICNARKVYFSLNRFQIKTMNTMKHNK
jgi:hypothetical protein